MAVPKLLVGIWASCFLISRAGTIDTHFDAAAMSISHLHREKSSKGNQASKTSDARRYLRVAATVGAPLQVAILWKLMGSPKLPVALKCIRKASLNLHRRPPHHQHPPNVSKSNVWLLCPTIIICALGLDLASRRRKVGLQRKQGMQKVVERRSRWGGTHTLDHQEQCHTSSTSASSNTSDSDLVLPANTRTVTNPSSGAHSQQLQEEGLAHVKGVVKDRCKSINDSLQRQPSVEGPELTSRSRRSEDKGGA